MSKVLKFGGTSVGSDVNIRKVATIIQDENSKVTVLSAMSGTTDTLVKICNKAKNAEDVSEEIAFLTEKYATTVSTLLNENKNKALAKINEVFSLIGHEAANFASASEGKILAQGELLTTAIFTMHLKEQGVKAELIDITKYMYTSEDGKADTNRLKSGLTSYMQNFDNDTYFVTQGFICTNHLGQFDNLGRGGSDYSAALIGAAICATVVQIWTDIDGMHNNDPRYVENTFPIRVMSFDEAAELAYFGAKILHPSTIQPCKENGISVQLKNTLEPKAEGTLITTVNDSEKAYHAVAAKDNITIVRITSARMLMAYGFLRRVFEVFEKYKTPIDMITTSEVAVSITIDEDKKIECITKELAEFGKVEIEHNNTIICVVGRIDHGKKGIISHILDGIINVPLKMISYGASDRSVAFLINSSDKITTLRELNKQLF